MMNHVKRISPDKLERVKSLAYGPAALGVKERGSKDKPGGILVQIWMPRTEGELFEQLAKDVSVNASRLGRAVLNDFLASNGLTTQ